MKLSTRFSLSRFATLVAVLWIGEVLESPAVFAQDPFAAISGNPTPVSRIDLGDDISVALPFGWRAVTLPNGVSGSDPKKLPDRSITQGFTLLLHARPKDEARNALLTVWRTSLPGYGGKDDTDRTQATRLRELTLAEGFRAETQSSTTSNDVARNDLTGVSGDGLHRQFCLVTKQVGSTEWCFLWQYDTTDEEAPIEVEKCLASMQLSSADLFSSMVRRAATPDLAAKNPNAPKDAPYVPAIKESADLVNKNRASLVVVSGDKGQGSGFVCNLDGESWLLTNIHVLSDNPHPRFQTMNGGALTPGPAFLAVDHDLCKLKCNNGAVPLEGLANMDATVRIGDAIVVLGNAEGQGVIHPFEGRVVGLGPNLVEVDAPFVPGNSGSPIIHVSTGKVIGIATYLVTRKADATGKNSVQTNIRRFGYRIDNVKTWETVNWARFEAQAQQVASIEANGADLERLFADARQETGLKATYNNPGIQRALDAFRSRRQTGKLSNTDLAFSSRELLANIRVATLSDINTFDNRSAYDFFRRKIADEKKFRDDVYSGLTRVLNAK